MKVISGHLTLGNKQAIKAILNNNLLSGRVGKTTYVISEINGIHTVKMYIKDRGLIPCPGSPLRISTYTASFKI